MVALTTRAPVGAPGKLRRASGAGADGGCPRDDGPAVSLAQDPQLGDLPFAQLRVAVGEVQHGIVKPLLLVLGRRFQDAAAEDMGEQLVTGLLELRGGRNSSRFRTLFGHARGAPLFRSGGRVLDAAPDLQRLLGNVRSELFHYEVRSTYDTPEVAESRRIVEEAERRRAELADGVEEPDGDEPWRRPLGQ